MGTKYFRPYIFGKEFDLQTDHQPIKWLHSKYTGKDINPRLQRWLIQLGEYDIKTDYIKGKQNKVADFLSRINSETNEINLFAANNFKKEDNSISTPNNATITVESMNNTENLSITPQRSTGIQTIHSQEEDLNDHIPLLETVVNRFKLQLILVEEKEREFLQVFNNKRVLIDKNDVEQETDIFRRHIQKGKVGIYSELNDREYNKLQEKLIQLYPNRDIVKFVKCSHLARDIENDEELKKQIAIFHKEESGHCGIVATYEGLKMRIYHPKLKFIIHTILNNCDICTGAKYDRKPIKRKFELTETPKTINEIVHVHIYTNSKHNFINSIDKFSKHAVSLYLEDGTHVTILEKIRQIIAIRGKMKKIIFDNEFDSKHIREFCKTEGIAYHVTKPNSHTGNADIERLNGTLTERIRALNLLRKVTYQNTNSESSRIIQ